MAYVTNRLQKDERRQRLLHGDWITLLHYALGKLLPLRLIHQYSDTPSGHKNAGCLALLWYLNTARNHFECYQLVRYSAWFFPKYQNGVTLHNIQRKSASIPSTSTLLTSNNKFTTRNGTSLNTLPSRNYCRLHHLKRSHAYLDNTLLRRSKASIIAPNPQTLVFTGNGPVH